MCGHRVIAAHPYPFIMMTQNRQQHVDRREAAADYNINRRAELEIELLQQSGKMPKEMPA